MEQNESTEPVSSNAEKLRQLDKITKNVIARADGALWDSSVLLRQTIEPVDPDDNPGFIRGYN